MATSKSGQAPLGTILTMAYETLPTRRVSIRDQTGQRLHRALAKYRSISPTIGDSTAGRLACTAHGCAALYSPRQRENDRAHGLFPLKSPYAGEPPKAARVHPGIHRGAYRMQG